MEKQEQKEKRQYTAPDIRSEEVEATALAVPCTCDCPAGDKGAFIPAAVSNFLP